MQITKEVTQRTRMVQLADGKVEVLDVVTIETWADKDGNLHRVGGPAYLVTNPEGEVITEKWYRDGVLHRDGEECALIYDGRKCWYKNGNLHRTNGPAVVDVDGQEEWYVEGRKHREDGPAKENKVTGVFTWYKDNQRHRTDGPAMCSSSGTLSWWQNNKRHRKDGPAVIEADGNKLWYLKGVQVKSVEEFKARTRMADKKIADIIAVYGDIK